MNINDDTITFSHGEEPLTIDKLYCIDLECYEDICDLLDKGGEYE